MSKIIIKKIKPLAEKNKEKKVEKFTAQGSKDNRKLFANFFQTGTKSFLETESRVISKFITQTKTTKIGIKHRVLVLQDC